MNHIGRTIICNENTMNKKMVKKKFVKVIFNHYFDDLGNQIIIKLR